MTRLILSMWQPWATLVVARDEKGRVAKCNETRGFAIRPGIERKLPLEIIIHAAQRTTELRALEHHEDHTSLNNYGVLFRNLLKDRGYTTRNVPLGAVVGVVTLVGQRRTEDLVGPTFSQITQQEQALGDYSPGRWAWFFSEPRALPVSIQFKGRQGILWPAPPELDAAIDRQLR